MLTMIMIYQPQLTGIFLFQHYMYIIQIESKGTFTLTSYV